MSRPVDDLKVSLGLAIAKGIIQAHGGTIMAESPYANEPGARVTFRLPIKEDRAE
jgi:two-component system, OmpR family, sensor histidine kinase KdpD